MNHYELMPEVAVFPGVLCTCLKTVGVKSYLHQPSQSLCGFCVRSSLTGDAEITSRTKGWLTKCQTGQNTWQTDEIESKCFLISPNMRKKLITLSNAQRAPHRGMAGRSAFHLKETGHTQEMSPAFVCPSMCPSVRACLQCWPGHSCWLCPSLLPVLS